MLLGINHLEFNRRLFHLRSWEISWISFILVSHRMLPFTYHRFNDNLNLKTNPTSQNTKRRFSHVLSWLEMTISTKSNLSLEKQKNIDMKEILWLDKKQYHNKFITFILSGKLKGLLQLTVQNKMNSLSFAVVCC